MNINPSLYGTFPRKIVEECEDIIYEYLCSDNIQSEVRSSSYLEALIATQIKNQIDDNIVNVRHIGNTYNSIGDIKIETENESIYCELKMSTNSDSTGTEFNISSNVIYKSDIFENSILTWSEFMDNHNHSQKVFSYLDSYDYYPNSIHTDYNTKIQKRKTLGRYIRETIKDSEYSVDEGLNCDNPEIRQAAEIKSGIMNYDREIKKKYLKYLSDKKINQSRLKSFVLVLCGGYHKTKQILNYMDLIDNLNGDVVDNIGDVFDNYRMFYSYVDFDNDIVNVKKAEQEKSIKKLSKKDNWDISFINNDSGSETTSFFIGFYENNEFVSVFRCSLNWGQVFQGIYNKRINGFKGEFFK